MWIWLAVYIMAQLLFTVVPLPRVFGAAVSDRRLTIFWVWVTVTNLVGAAVNIAHGDIVSAAFNALWAVVSAFFAWLHIRRTRRGKRVAKLIGEKAKTIRAALVRTQRETERKLRAAVPRIAPDPA